MTTSSLRAALGRGLDLAREQAAVLAVFAGTLFLSALLLFSVQPMFAKMVLPRLGGSPSVWAVSMCFFQAVLLAGYCYAHALNRLVAPRLAPAVHLALVAVAVLALPISISASEPPAGDAYLWLIGTLALGVGLPFFAVSANAPLLQAWFARTGHPHAADPYFLYGASNLGSLAALLLYPIAIEPVIGLKAQSGLWTAGFLLLGALIAVCGVVGAANARETAGPSSSRDLAVLPALRWTDRARWIALSFVPSGLLVAFTTYVTTDIASAPFLWVIPLALFLLTFILVFRDAPPRSHALMLRLQPIAVALVLFGIGADGNTGWLITSLAGVAAFFISTMVCHRELYEHRPAAGHLTEFYLWMSLGGVLGGIFAALVSPQVFNAIYEFPLLLVLAMALRPGMRNSVSAKDWRELGALAAAALVVMALVGLAGTYGLVRETPLPRTLAVIGLAALLVLRGRAAPNAFVYTALMAAAVVLLPSSMNRGNAERSFFGTHRVSLMENGAVRVLLHGTTVHGAERIKDRDGKPVARPVPATYYHPEGPMARGVTAARSISGKPETAFRAGIIGLGAGSMACHARTAETWRFYEIDPVVVRIARDPSRFTFLSRCRPDADIVLGDARLTLAKEKPQSFDYLVIDAFSSDSVPVHLLTREAMQLYVDKLAPRGILAMHVSNRHLDLIEVATSLTKAHPGLVAAVVDDKAAKRGLDAARSHVVFFARSREALAPVLAWHDARAVAAPRTQPWTDDYSDILSALWAKYVRR
ncbi:MAG: fused MFS/spermidine synthase [Hyphomicrobiaceae bacterium]|nr:fused MFS/spermidine synthase [Hyphomicrobiaceae bacterium]